MTFNKKVTYTTLAQRLRTAGPVIRTVGTISIVLTLLATTKTAKADPDELRSLASMPLGSLLDVEVSGASKFSQPLRNTPSSATVITASEIFALGYRNLSDVLRSVRGLNVSSDRAYAYLGVRGMAAPGDYNTRVLLLIDGNRINDAVYDQAYLGSEFPLDLDMVERVEFIPGPGSAVHGANALWGVVNVVTKRNQAEQLATGSISVGSGGSRVAKVALQTGEAGNHQLMLSASRTLERGRDLYYPQYDAIGISNGISSGTDGEVQNRLYLRFEDGTGFSATVVHADRDKGASATTGTVFNSKLTRFRDTQTNATLQWNGRVSADTEVTARAYASRYEFVGSYAIDYPPVTINRDTVYAQSTGLELRALTSKWKMHKVVAGVEVQKTPHLEQANFDLDPRFVYLDDQRTAHRISLFAEDQIEITPKWSLSLGGRYDNTELGKGVFSPRVGVVWQHSAEWVVKYLHGTAYRQPNAFERYYAFPGVGGYKTNPDLQKENVRGQELTVEYQPSTSIKWATSLYRNRINGLIVQHLDTQDGLLKFENREKFSTSGFEVEVQAVLPYQSHLRANYARQQVGGTLSSQAARDIGNLTLVVPLKASWVFGLSGTAVSRRADASGFAVADATISNDAPWRAWRVAFSVYNVLNRRATDPSSDALLPGTIPQDRRGLRVKLDLRF